MKDIDGKELQVGDKILVVGSELRHATIINILPDKAVYSKFYFGDKEKIQITKLTDKQIYKL